MIDFHSHILWDMDDGSDNMEQSLAMASIAVSEGIDTIVATPHCIDEKDLDGFADKVQNRCQVINDALKSKDMDLNIVPGAEVYIDPDLLDREELPRLGLNGTRYVLVELPMREIPLYTEDFLYKLQLKGCTPIISHPERNIEIISNPNALLRLMDLGALAQINTGSITGFFGSKVKECARILLTHGMGHILGTDAHSDGRRGPYISEAIKQLRQWIGQEALERLIEVYPSGIFAGEVIEVGQPREYAPGRGIFSFFRRRT